MKALKTCKAQFTQRLLHKRRGGGSGGCVGGGAGKRQWNTSAAPFSHALCLFNATSQRGICIGKRNSEHGATVPGEPRQIWGGGDRKREENRELFISSTSNPYRISRSARTLIFVLNSEMNSCPNSMLLIRQTKIQSLI